MKKIAIITACLLLNSCATTVPDKNAYQDVPYNRPHATLDSSTSGLINFTHTGFKEVDGKKIQSDGTYITPGSHTVLVAVMQDSDSTQAEFPLHFTAVAGETYTVKMEQQGNRLVGWIVNSRGQAVSGKASHESDKQGAVDASVNEMAR